MTDEQIEETINDIADSLAKIAESLQALVYMVKKGEGEE